MDRRHSAELLGNRASVSGQLESRSEGSTLVFNGYGSTTAREYDMGWYDEEVLPGAFKRTLGMSPDVSFLINHDGLPYARTTNGSLTLREDDIGLGYEARTDGDRYPAAREAANAVEDGLLYQCSFAFRVDEQEWNDDYSKRTIKTINLHRGDVSVVTNGANPDTPVSVSMRSFMVRLAQFDDELEMELRADFSPEELEAAFESMRRILRPAVDPVIGDDPEYDLDLFRARANALRLHGRS